MLTTFAICLREGLEASLIVGIIAAFLKKQGRQDLLRWVWIGVSIAVALCLAVGAALEIVSANLPQAKQEGLETVVGGLAVAMVTYMVVWMRQHSRELKKMLEGATADALASGSGNTGRAMVLMAFLAVLREGFETVVFLLAAFNETGNSAGPVLGSILGLVVAVGLGYALYRGGVKINLSKFFRATGLVLTLVAAGLVLTALHTAHEAGWLNIGQHQVLNLTWLVRSSTSVQSSLLTGLLGVQQYPVTIEVIGWLTYFVPIGLYVAWPPGKGLSRRNQMRFAFAGAFAGIATAITLPLVAPAVAASPTTTFPGGSVRFFGAGPRSSAKVLIHTSVGDMPPYVSERGTGTIDGVAVTEYAGSLQKDASGPSPLTDTQIASLNHGRLPLGVPAGGKPVLVSYESKTIYKVFVATGGTRVLQLSTVRQKIATLHAHVGIIPLYDPVTSATVNLPAATVSTAAAAARADASSEQTAADDHEIAWFVGVIGVLFLLAGLNVNRRERVLGNQHIDLTSPTATPVPVG